VNCLTSPPISDAAELSW